MEFSTLQSRPSSSFFPPHRTQLHPRMMTTHVLPFPSPPQTKPQSSTHHHKLLLLFASLLTAPFLFYLFSTAHKIHHSSRFASVPKPQSFSVLLHLSPSRSRVVIYEMLGEANYLDFTNTQLPLVVGSMNARRRWGQNDGGRVVEELVGVAKGRVPKRDWGNSAVQLLMVKDVGAEMQMNQSVLEDCRRVLRESGFVFKDPWARVVQDEDKGVYAWVAANYVLGNLGHEPEKTTGIVELGGTSLQITFASREVSQVESLQVIKFAGVTYRLQTKSLPKFGQEAVWESLLERHNSKESLASHGEGFVGNPCIPKGFHPRFNVSDEKPVLFHPAGNFTACKVEALALLKSRQGKCLHLPCKIVSPFFVELQGKPVSQENLFYASELFGLVPRVSLFHMEAAGQHYCEDDWQKLKSQHHGIDEFDLLRYCFSSAYIMALLHDSLRISTGNKRIGFSDANESSPLDWTLGAFILLSTLEHPESETDNLAPIVGNESVAYFCLFAFLLIALLAAFFQLQWQKPQYKTIYDLEKGHYIFTRVPR